MQPLTGGNQKGRRCVKNSAQNGGVLDEGYGAECVRATLWRHGDSVSEIFKVSNTRCPRVEAQAALCRGSSKVGSNKMTVAIIAG